jgi:hypothetical protein
LRPQSIKKATTLMLPDYCMYMGRARSQTHAVSGFEAVLGTRRGSVVAQAQRDTDEDEQRKAALLGFPEKVGDILRRERSGMSGQEIARSLVFDYEDHLSEKWSRRRILKNWRELDESIPNNYDTLPGLVVITDLGDPVGSPGLTEPAMQALCDYFVFTKAIDFGAHTRPVSFAGTRAEKRDRATFVINKLFLDRRPLEYYLRFARLCEVLGPVIADLAGDDAEDQGLGERAARALRVAPEDALTGPMRGWVDAFTALVREDAITWNEERELNQLVAKYRPSTDGAGTATLAALASALSQLNNAHA